MCDRVVLVWRTHQHRQTVGDVMALMLVLRLGSWRRAPPGLFAEWLG